MRWKRFALAGPRRSNGNAVEPPFLNRRSQNCGIETAQSYGLKDYGVREDRFAYAANYGDAAAMERGRRGCEASCSISRPS